MVISACQHACPAGIDVPNYVAAIACGNYEQAVDIIRERNPFPAVCGRICIHPCETKCRRGELDEAIAIRTLKRFASDWYFENIGMAEKPFPVTRSQRIAVVGAGPAGLTCAYFLSQMGYKASVFESQQVAGGMLGIAVPEFRLPREVIEEEVAYIESCGIDIHYNEPIDASHTVNELLQEGFSAVFIAAGAQASKQMGIPGEELALDGLYYGLPFLTDIRSGEKMTLSGKVAVIGGGNVAFDTARTALRVGAQDVHLYYRRGIDEMPAWKKDIEEAIEEGVIIKPFWSPARILHDDKKVTGIEFVGSKTILEQDGTSYVKEDPEQLLQVDADAVIIAVGQAPDASFISKESQLERSLWGSLEVDRNSLTTNVAGIFAGGDFITGPTTVISAIASGRRAAIAIDHYLAGIKGPIKIVDEKTQFQETAGLALETESTEEKPRIQIKIENPALRSRDFREVEKGFTEEQARIEAARCLRCDLEEK